MQLSFVHNSKSEVECYAGRHDASDYIPYRIPSVRPGYSG